MSLGCGEWSVVVTGRGGGAVAASDVPATSVTVTRRLSETGEAAIDVVDRRVCATLGESVRSWSHEVALYRDGGLAFVGPIVGRRISGDRLSWRVRDVSAWLDRRFARGVAGVVGADAAEVAARVVDAAFAVDPVGAAVEWGEIGVRVSRGYVEADGKPASVALDDLVASGGSWLVDGRRVLVGAAVPTSSIGEVFGDAWAEEPDVEEDGMVAVTRAVVAGPNRNGDAVVGDETSRAAVAQWGVLEQRYQDDGAVDAATASRIAARLVASRAAPARLVSSGELAASAPFAFADVAPGRRVWATVRGAGRALCVIRQVSVKASGGVESVAVDVEAA